ncbi:LacI family DNA-binding transcriptional regulator [Gracilibacillus alcaliphilus]|uniref:LacI family DNA-binding transcriptional regulator n=1 Tax=Gracilibacillus alcaliphilus TaxID=1401441 RepID=UPI00195B2539|nr:LacI family DNA-binding transcriptional regulator [Gracilibacillus alcaliphilus]MBM7677302.1 LacI family transcriptional regulator [Gracilibacillus alcaliphilus]
MITMRDVAKKAGVSVATVSRIMNGKGKAGTETIARVNQVIEELNYKPNAIAKSLSERKSNLIALLVPTLSNPFFPELVREIEMEANRQGYRIFLCNSDDDRDKVEYYLNSMIDHYVSGAIINSLHVGKKDLDSLEERGIRTITIDRANFEHPYSNIIVDHQFGGQIAVSHLMNKKNRKKIVFISGPKHEKSSQDRLAGFYSALEKLEEKTETKIVYSDFSVDDGYEAIKRLLKQSETFDSIFSSNDAMAIGAMRACYEYGLKIPEDVSIVGYDNIQMASFVQPPLSTVDQHKQDIGAKAVDELIRLLNDEQAKPKQYRLKPVLIPRRTS